MQPKRLLRQARNKVLRPMPPRVGEEAGDTMRPWRRLRYYGNARQCPVCESKVSRFVETPQPFKRPEAMCPVCGALEWHRMGWWFLSRRHPEFLSAGKRVAHVAAEAEIRERFKAIPGLTYAALDLDLRRATVMADLLALPFADDTIDLVYCAHVLEHVDDERLALREMRRVITPTGAALLQVPITTDKTFGDPSIIDPQERLRLFGQLDHVRRFGPDVVDIIGDCGWKVEQVKVGDLPADDVHKYGLPKHSAEIAGDVFWCTPA